ncbi:hypothetical protein F3087_40040 [Nocardia colli]|uniref:Uncharacterized protein n=1 Tax=Nocardia colli TaxID=2545717 RepID=A0A5N0E0W8_9NOCA|nr:hypothetical protein [Nocardia colli]KAA8881865.1 hypothetical protein F3087_40040 [Nocardia colli]
MATALEVAAEVIAVVQAAVLVELAALAASFIATMATPAGPAAGPLIAAAARRICEQMWQSLLAYVAFEVVEKAIAPLEDSVKRLVDGVVYDAMSDAIGVAPPAGSTAVPLIIEPDELRRYAEILDSLADDIVEHAAVFADHVAGLEFTAGDRFREPVGVEHSAVRMTADPVSSHRTDSEAEPIAVGPTRAPIQVSGGLAESGDHHHAETDDQHTAAPIAVDQHRATGGPTNTHATASAPQIDRARASIGGMTAGSPGQQYIRGETAGLTDHPRISAPASLSSVPGQVGQPPGPEIPAAGLGAGIGHLAGAGPERPDSGQTVPATNGGGASLPPTPWARAAQKPASRHSKAAPQVTPARRAGDTTPPATPWSRSTPTATTAAAIAPPDATARGRKRPNKAVPEDKPGDRSEVREPTR